MELPVITHPAVERLCWMKVPSPLPESWKREGRSLLTREEEERYEKFRHNPSQEMFLAARLLAKTLLGDLTGRSPDSLTFSYREEGKPYLAEERELFFNFSHSAQVVAFLSSDKGETGVDVEEVRDRDCLNLARHFFSEGEVEALEREAFQEGMIELFFRIWTQKEAYLKGTGKGLPGGLKNFTVPLITGKGGHGGFIIENFLPCPGIMGAYALPSR